MARPFNFSAWTKFQDQPIAYPGKPADTSELNGVSGCPVGGPGVYGRVMVRGPNSHPGTNLAPLNTAGRYAATDRYFTEVDSVCLPDKNRTHLRTENSVAFPTGQTFAAAGINLPLDAGGLLIPVGVGIWTEHGYIGNTPLAQPFGLGDLYYQGSSQGQLGMAQDGRLWAYCEEDVRPGDALFFRTATTSTTDGVQLLGAFGKTAGANFQAAPWAKVFRPGAAGGAFVVSLNGVG